VITKRATSGFATADLAGSWTALGFEAPQTVYGPTGWVRWNSQFDASGNGTCTESLRCDGNTSLRSPVTMQVDADGTVEGLVTTGSSLQAVMSLDKDTFFGVENGTFNGYGLSLSVRRTDWGPADLGLIAGTKAYDNLTLDSTDDVDWYKFTATGQGTTAHRVQIDFTNTEGDLALAVYRADGTLVGQKDGTTNTEQVSLAGLASGDYYVKIWSVHQDVSRKYKLTIVA
jgi:hypothetical protein